MNIVEKYFSSQNIRFKPDELTRVMCNYMIIIAKSVVKHFPMALNESFMKGLTKHTVSIAPMKIAITLEVLNKPLIRTLSMPIQPWFVTYVEKYLWRKT